jgi:PIN domain nuclease of toxin-antitoxin system
VGSQPVIVLDTHAWIWWVGESPDLSRRAKQAIAKADEIGVHAISCWEVAMLVSRKRLGLSMDVDDWIGEALRYPKVTLLPLEPSAAVLATRLPGSFHNDPADRFIVSACLSHGAPLVTKDRRIHDWRQIPVIW